MRLFGKKKTEAGGLEKEKPPRHVAIIMDGNGRWAKKRGLPRTAGHAVGAETFRKIATFCNDIGIEHLTVYAFSTENWKRPADEVEKVMELLEKYLFEAIEKMEKDNVRIKILGDTSILSEKLRRLIAEAEKISEAISGMQANICINYGGRDEILKACEAYAKDAACGAARLTEERFSGYLYSAGIPDPDLVIRPSGECRVSNFLLWQSAYSEFYFTDVLWPDFDENELKKAFADYAKRQRRYGGV